MKERISEIAKVLEPDMISFAQKLIRCPSLSGQEKEVALIIKEELEKLGYDEAFIDDYGNVVGIVHGTKPGNTIMYNGHIDHVDIGERSEWGKYDPYGGEIDEVLVQNEARDAQETAQVIHGRAASDTKGGMACQIYSGAILAKLKKEGYDVVGNYIFSGVVFEEPAEQTGMKGLMEDTFPKRGIKVDGVVSCEATGLMLYLGHRGKTALVVDVEGVSSHGSAPWLGVNALSKAAKIINKIEEIFAAKTDSDPQLGKSTIAPTIIKSTPGEMCVVPDRCSVTFDRRFLPWESAESCVKEIEDIIEELKKDDPQIKATVRIAEEPRHLYTGKVVTIPNIKEAWKIPPTHPFVEAAAKGLSDIGETVRFGYWDFGTDLAVICGTYHMAAIGYSPMQELYCHRSVDMVRIDFMNRALIGNLAIFNKLVLLDKNKFSL
jgi:putative selenium metabolism hydrolase